MGWRSYNIKDPLRSMKTLSRAEGYVPGYFMPKQYSDAEFEAERKREIKAAKELGYGPACVKRLRHAKTMNEISRIMTTFREQD